MFTVGDDSIVVDLQNDVNDVVGMFCDGDEHDVVTLEYSGDGGYWVMKDLSSETMKALMMRHGVDENSVVSFNFSVIS
ncbi:hypothetical protein F0562_015667 [Nyssa sinensis]|uniref:Uncharacterized protein n=1 Tax=Nyssa sinensis TaxID=561372 RepID=A0A5J4ZHL1_9ASTE|nr:hypothetical protein F0562_015667 [Nyssa sinensis]